MHQNPNIKQAFKPVQVGNLLYRIMESEDYTQAAEIASYQFTQNEPMISGVNATKEQFLGYLDVIRDHVFANPVSLVAVDTDKNIVVGSLISEDYNCDEGDDALISENINSVLRYLTTVKTQIQSESLVVQEKHTVHHVFFASIHKDYEGKGIVKMLFEINKQLASHLNYKYVIAECTHAITQHICGTQGFNTIYTMPFSEMNKWVPRFNVSEQQLKMFKAPNVPGIKIMLQQLVEVIA